MSNLSHSTESQEYEALLQFLYMAPVGLVQLSSDGTIIMLNPLSAQLLMPLSRDGELTNLFDALAPVAPDLQLQCSKFSASYGQICDATRLYLHADGAASGTVRRARARARPRTSGRARGCSGYAARGRR